MLHAPIAPISAAEFGWCVQVLLRAVRHNFLNIDDTFDNVDDHEQLHLFNSYYDYSQSIVGEDNDGRSVGAVLPP